MLETIYYNLYNHKNWSFYLAWVDDKVVFTGTSPADKDELEAWLTNLYPNSKLSKKTLPKSLSDVFNDYFEGKNKKFNLSALQKGTDFQKKVWNELNKIPYGETRTYGEIAKAIGKDRSASRAVGTAVGKNPTLILCPCHRVVPKSGEARGYRGGLEMKQALLELESKD